MPRSPQATWHSSPRILKRLYLCSLPGMLIAALMAWVFIVGWGAFELVRFLWRIPFA